MNDAPDVEARGPFFACAPEGALRPAREQRVDVLRAPYTLSYAYKRSLGPVLSQFMTGLREGKILGIRSADGRVLVPPTEYDPQTSEALHDLVQVADAGVVMSWAFIDAPRPGQPLDRPFAWALVRLDGADTDLLHAVDAGTPERMRTGMRVRARWSDERTGRIQDIACFEPVEQNQEAR
jgi:uncharacterized OB-fold protein